MGSTAVAAIAGVLALLLWWKKRAPKLAAVLALVAGAGIAGVTGGAIHQGAAVAGSLSARLTSSAFGAAVPALLAIVAGFVFLHDMLPKGKASTVTLLAGFILPVLVTSLPGVAGSFGSSLIATVSAGVNSAIAAVLGG